MGEPTTNGDRMRMARLRRGRTIGDVATWLDVSTADISKYERDLRLLDDELLAGAWGFIEAPQTVGITGTRYGLTTPQLRRLCRALQSLRGVYFAETLVHGDCLGADAFAHGVAGDLGFDVVLQPPTDHRWRAFCLGGRTRPERGYRDRNAAIVAAADFVVALPCARSRGTWMTVNMAKKKRRPVVVIRPDGGIEADNWPSPVEHIASHLRPQVGWSEPVVTREEGWTLLEWSAEPKRLCLFVGRTQVVYFRQPGPDGADCGVVAGLEHLRELWTWLTVGHQVEAAVASQL